MSSPPRYSSLRPGTRAQWWTSWWLAATLGLAIVAVAAGPVVAQPASSGRQARADASVGDPEAPPETRDAAQADEYRVAVAEGTDAFRAGRYQDARAAFQRAYEIHADHVLLFNIASCWRRTGDTDAAIAAYRRFLEAAPIDDDRREIAEQTIRFLEADRAPAPAPPTPERPGPLSLTAKIGLGVGAVGLAGLATGGVYGWLAYDRQRELESRPFGTPWDDGEEQLYREGARFSRRARLLGFGGGALIATGITLVLVGGRDRRPAVVVGAGPHGVSLSFAGGF